MRYILLFWGLPLSVFWGWYFLSLNDMNFGFLMLSRLVHDFAFEMYGSILGIDPERIPGLIARACALDTALIFGILGFRRRNELKLWLRSRRARNDSKKPQPIA